MADEDLANHYWPSKNHYQVLGVARHASLVEIKKAYRVKARELHPDKNRDDKDAAAKFERVALSYAVLSDADERKWYDAGLS